MVLDAPVLVLNRSFAALALTDARRGFTLFYKGHVRAVLPDFTTYGWGEWCDIPIQPEDVDVVRTPTTILKVPRVIQLLSCDRPPRYDVKFSRHNIYVRDGTRCQYCGKRFATSELSLDHVVPLSRGGVSSWENVVCACLRCNVRKGNRLPDEAGMALRRLPARPRPSPLGLLAPSRIHPAWRNFLDVAYWTVELASASDRTLPPRHSGQRECTEWGGRTCRRGGCRLFGWAVSCFCEESYGSWADAP